MNRMFEQVFDCDWKTKLVALTCVLCYLVWYLWNKRSRDSPPGFNGLPLIGVLPYLGSYPERSMGRWNKKYGDVCMVKIGMTDVVILGSVEAAREAFVKSTSFADRPQEALGSITGGYGILMINSGDFHQEQRRFGVNTLRLLGMGRRSLAPRLVEISNKMCEKIDALCGADGKSRPFEMKMLTYETISHIISQMFFGHEVGEKNEDFRQILMDIVEPNVFDLLFGLLLFAPFLRHFPFFRMLRRRQEAFRIRVENCVKKEIPEHLETWQQGEPRDFIDHFLEAMHQQKNSQTSANSDKENGKETTDAKKSTADETAEEKRAWVSGSSFSTNQLVQMGRDLFLAATDTSSTSISWALLYLSQHPDAQIKIQTEIDNVLGEDGDASPLLINKFPYLRAVLQEVARLRPVVPLAVPHVASKSDMLMGYRIPKGAILFSNIWAIHHDRNIWKDPEMFKPERHLDSESRFVNSPNIVQFNIGSRSCLGQELAKSQLFVVMVSLLRRFTFELSEGHKVNMRGRSFVTLKPPIYKVVVTRR